jgi:hypothetical protein
VDRLGAVRHAETRQDAGDVDLHSVGRDRQHPADLDVAQALGHQLEDLPLTAAERHRRAGALHIDVERRGLVGLRRVDRRRRDGADRSLDRLHHPLQPGVERLDAELVLEHHGLRPALRGARHQRGDVDMQQDGAGRIADIGKAEHQEPALSAGAVARVDEGQAVDPAMQQLGDPVDDSSGLFVGAGAVLEVVLT